MNAPADTLSVHSRDSGAGEVAEGNLSASRLYIYQLEEQNKAEKLTSKMRLLRGDSSDLQMRVEC